MVGTQYIRNISEQHVTKDEIIAELVNAIYGVRDRIEEIAGWNVDAAIELTAIDAALEKADAA